MAETYQSKSKLNIIADEPDNRLLGLAQTCNADFIITGNTKDFTMEAHEKTKIVTPQEYWKEHE